MKEHTRDYEFLQTRLWRNTQETKSSVSKQTKHVKTRKSKTKQGKENKGNGRKEKHPIPVLITVKKTSFPT